MNLFFWRKERNKSNLTLNQDWILEGFQDCVDGFWVWQSNQFYISSRIKTRLGYDLHADVKFTDINWWRDFVHPEDMDKLKKFLKDIVKNEVKTRQIEIRIRHYHGHWVWFLIHCYVGSFRNNQPQVLGTFSDVSAYRLLHDQLEKTIEDLETVSQEKSHFISHLNHEIRTPINGILGGLTQLQETDLNLEQQDCLNKVSACADLLLNLVNEILDLSKIAAGKLEIDPVEFELDRVIQQVFSMLKPVAQQKKLQLILDMDGNLPHFIKTDSLRLQQVIINLLSNAIKFTDAGKVTLEIKLHQQKTNGNSSHLLFRIIDTGHGISKDVLPFLFQDFTQASKSVARTYGGTGLGLSICRKLIALMGGEIGAQSTVGKGSTFWFILPIENIKNLKAVSPTTNEKKENSLNRFNILIAEDNHINQQVLIGLLSSLNQDFSIANNGIEAIQLFENNRFDLIFMDMNMPILDGFSATKQIRQMEKGKKIPIIILTADTYSIDKQEFLKNGVTQIVHKPVTKEKLFNVIEFYQQEDAKEEENSSHESSISSPHKSTDAAGEINFKYINESQITTLSKDIGEETLIKLMDVYVKDGMRIMSQLKGDKSDGFYDVAHTLAGMSENLGMKKVAQLSRDVMISLRTPDENPSLLINQLLQDFNETVVEIDKLKDKFSPKL